MLEGPKKFSSGNVRWINIGHWVVNYFVIVRAGHIFILSLLFADFSFATVVLVEYNKNLAVSHLTCYFSTKTNA